MSLQSQFESKVLLEKIEPLTVIKNEPEIGMDQDITSPDIKDEIDIMYNIIPEDLIKSEPIPNNLLEIEHLGSMETQIFVKTENTSFIKTEFENLVKIEDTSDENLSVEESQMKRDLIIKHVKKQTKHHKYEETEHHQLQTYTKKQRRTFGCKKCTYRTYNCEKLNLHKLSHEADQDDRHLKYRCNKCNYKTFRLQHFKDHKVIHLKPEEIQYFYCYHCSYKAKQKSTLRDHIFRHFKNEEVPFHCYICDFVTVKRDLIIKHFKKHPKYRSKCDETDYKISLNLVRKRYCCKKCMFRTYHYEKLKLHELTHKEMDDRYLKYQCDKCTYKTFNKAALKVHQLIHLKPEEIQYFYCYHCSYKAKQKIHLKDHISRHFKNEVVKFHCYICSFMTLERKLITEHIKKHSKVQVKSNINKRT